MDISEFLIKVKRKIKNIVKYYFVQYPRIIKYKIISDCQNVIGKPIYNQPTLLSGDGSIIFGKNVNLGVVASPF